MLHEKNWLRLVRAGWALGAGFLALSAFIAASVFFYVKQQSNDAVIRRAMQVEIALIDVFSDLQDAELGQRGYLLTGNDAFLQPYRSGEERFTVHLDSLSDRIGGFDALAAPFTTLQALASAKRAEMAGSIQVFAAGREEEAVALVRSGEGKRIMGEIRALIADMDGTLDRLVERHEQRVRIIGDLVAGSIAAAVILLGFVALAALREAARRSELSRFLPAELSDRLAAGDVSLRKGRELPAAIAFVDIRGSTALAQRLAVADLSTMLSRYRADVLAAAEASGGIVDKFIGDGALVVFGLHDEEGRAAAQSIHFARALRRRHRDSQAGGSNVAFDIGIGIHHGVVFCGLVGTAKRLEFTVLGDPVNLAARIEKTTKAHGVDVLVSGAVLSHAGEPAENWHELPCVEIRGAGEPVRLFAESAPALRAAA